MLVHKIVGNLNVQRAVAFSDMTSVPSFVKTQQNWQKFSVRTDVHTNTRALYHKHILLTNENKLKIIIKCWLYRKPIFAFEVMNVEIYDTCEDKRNLCTEFEPENIVITPVTNSSLGCDCLHRAQFPTFYRLGMVPAFISGCHVRVTPKRTRNEARNASEAQPNPKKYGKWNWATQALT
jgi:hypothetical protein